MVGAPVILSILVMLLRGDGFSVPSINANCNRAVLFDCDGVLVETEESHRIAYNKAFQTLRLKVRGGDEVHWTAEYYDRLQNSVGGGKPKMRHFFENDLREWPTSQKPYRRAPRTNAEKSALIDLLQDTKNKHYLSMTKANFGLRPGVLELLDEALADPQTLVGVCSASTKSSVEWLLRLVLGEQRVAALDLLLAGDDVALKKPHPLIYTTAAQRLHVLPDRCVVVEDSLIGLQAAKAAHMRCVVTFTESTRSQDFAGAGADRVLPDLHGVALQDMWGWCQVQEIPKIRPSSSRLAAL